MRSRAATLSLSQLDVGMAFSFEALGITVLLFGVIFLFTSIRAYQVIYRYKLIELFQAEKIGDSVPKASTFLPILSILLLGGSYWLLLQTGDSNRDYLIGMTLITGGIITGTYLLFRYITIFLLQKSRKHKAFFYKGMNIISVSKLLHHIKGNALTLTIISLLSAVTLSLFSTVYSMYYFQEARSKEFIPFSFEHLSTSDSYHKEVQQILTKEENHSLEVELEIPIIEGISDFKAPGNYPSTSVKIMAESTFNTAMKALGNKDSVQLSPSEAVMMKPRLTEHTVQDYRGEPINIQFLEKESTFTFTDMVKNHVLSWAYPDFQVIISDEDFSVLEETISPIVYTVYKVSNQTSTEAISDQLFALDSSEEAKLMSFFKEYNEGIQISGLNLFLLGFLGLVFLAATGSIIYFKQLTEAHASKDSYTILHKLGVNTKEIRISITKQSLFILGFPLIVGIAHSIMILQGIKTLYGATDYNLFIPMLVAMSAYILIYICYFFLTVKSYNKIVNNT